MKQVAERVKKPTPDDHLVVYSDGNDDYTYVLPQFFDVENVDYGQLVKIREGGRVVDKIRNVVYGLPFVNCIHTIMSRILTGFCASV